MKSLHSLFFSSFVCLFALTAHAQDSNPLDHKPEPGNTGAYAFAFIDHAQDAKIGDHMVIDLRMDAGKDNLGNVQGGMLRIRIPFAQWVEIEANAVSDAWQITQATAERYEIQKKQSRIDGDLNFKTKVRILAEQPNRPAIAFQATAKTAAGDFTSTHRYTDSAGYEFSVLASKEVLDSPETLIKKIRILSELAFIAWDTQVGQQNDSGKISAGVQASGDGFKFRMSFLGYYGWQDPKVDFVSTLQFEASKDLKNNFQVYGQTNVGLSKASTPLLVGGGVRYFLNAPKFRKKNKARK